MPRPSKISENPGPGQYYPNYNLLEKFGGSLKMKEDFFVPEETQPELRYKYNDINRKNNRKKAFTFEKT